MQWIFTLADIQKIATEFWNAVNNATVLAFYGEMGSGKTTFIHALCDVKKVKDTVGSPTFSIINEYVFDENEAEKKIYHIDLYRVKDEEEARLAGVEDCLYSGNICLVEWPAKASSLLPENTLNINLKTVDPETRRLIIEGK
jgi:tRNA threonylcarbamoyladenosine biosynthesis protein TsaE